MGGSIEGHEIMDDGHTIITDMISSNLPVINRSNRTTRHGKKKSSPYRAKAHDFNQLKHHADGSGNDGSPTPSQSKRDEYVEKEQD